MSEPVPKKTERHIWKLGENEWAELSITSPLNSERLERLRRYMALLDAEDPVPEPPPSLRGEK